MQAYCLRCQRKTEVRGPAVGRVTRRQVEVIKGTCAQCGRAVSTLQAPRKALKEIEA